jgi:hypothetical protein
MPMLINNTCECGKYDVEEADKGWSSTLRGLTRIHHDMKCYTGPQVWKDSLALATDVRENGDKKR